MKIELKSVKHAEFASEETECFNATIYIDGKKAGTVSNEGRGGNNRYDPWAIQKTIDDFAITQPQIKLDGVTAAGTDVYLTPDADMVIGDLLNSYLETKQLKRLCSTKTVFRIAGQTYAEGEYNTIKSKFSPAIRAEVIKRHGANVTFLNETLKEQT